MSRRLPLCAWCGTSLARAPERVLHQYLGVLGQPTIGWHLACADVDALYQSSVARRRVEPAAVDRRRVPEIVRTVDARGPARVVAGSAWYRAFLDGAPVEGTA